ncbi:MAG TPA: alpha/beta hydrolase [Ktedonobacteraceae bacterium]|nr:alpha/beta hydrolase [Ktedonobacteraceae bacterium]
MSKHQEKLVSKWAKVNGLPMHARISVNPLPDDTPVVVLVHGLSVSSGYMVPTAQYLAPYYRVYAPDLPGFGKSAKPSHILNVTELADALAAWMQVMGLRTATLVGNSLGCQIIVDFALRYPTSVERAVLVGPTMDPKARSIRHAALRLLQDARCEPLSYMPVLLREYLAAGITRTLRTLQYAFEDKIEEQLPRVHIPMLVVRGSRDPIVPQDWATQVDYLLPDSQLILVQGAGHAVNFNSPEELVRIVRAFMDEREALSIL